MINTDHWNERWPDHPVIRTFEPAKPVKVDIGRALHSAAAGHRAPITSACGSKHPRSTCPDTWTAF